MVWRKLLSTTSSSSFHMSNYSNCVPFRGTKVGTRNQCEHRATDDQGISRQLAPKPLLRQLKRRPIRPHHSLWRNSLENLSAARDTVAACHMFSSKNKGRYRLIYRSKNSQRKLPRSQKNQTRSFTVRCGL